MSEPAPPSDGSADLTVLCVDDNEQVAGAVRTKLRRTPGFAWSGWLSSADRLVETATRDRPDAVVLDVDLAGVSPFDALAELSRACPDVRVVMFSGHVGFDLIERAMEAGAWGYVSKNDGEDALIWALRETAAGEIAMSREVTAAYGR